MKNYAGLDDITALFRKLTPEEAEKAEALLPVVSASLNEEARKVGKNLEEMVKKDENLAQVAKSVTVDVVGRALLTSTEQEPITQYSESALGYTASGTYLVPGGGLFIKKSELARLGLRRQRIGVMEVYGKAERDNGSAV